MSTSALSKVRWTRLFYFPTSVGIAPIVYLPLQVKWISSAYLFSPVELRLRPNRRTSTSFSSHECKRGYGQVERRGGYPPVSHPRKLEAESLFLRFFHRVGYQRCADHCSEELIAWAAVLYRISPVGMHHDSVLCSNVGRETLGI